MCLFVELQLSRSKLIIESFDELGPEKKVFRLLFAVHKEIGCIAILTVVERLPVSWHTFETTVDRTFQICLLLLFIYKEKYLYLRKKGILGKQFSCESTKLTRHKKIDTYCDADSDTHRGRQIRRVMLALRIYGIPVFT